MASIDYANGGSFLHRLDPRTKLLLVLLFTILVFVIDSLAVAAGLMLFFAAVCLSARIPLKKLFPHWRFLLFLAAFVLVVQMLFGREAPGCRYLLKPLFPQGVPLLGGRGSLKLDGLFTGLMICCRIVALTILLPTLTRTTDARQLAYGITRLGLHYKAAHVITSTLNLIPSFEEETKLILEARRLRGVRSFENGGLLSKLKEYGAIALPLMIRAMRKAQIISLAMDARAFGAHKTRTWLFATKMSAIDYTAFACGIAFSAAAVAAQLLITR
ncbi:MAG: energy-coupling factor transporter transmembrane protein EcfT [Treponema sp.]|nr:energy-coupling factor transporter transmembrane protein EcfT [Treponema sp.]